MSTAIGARVMEAEEQEPFTLIAVGVCGGGYRNEWESNLTPGEGRLHEGFANASQLVVDRLSGYIATRQIRDRIKVWISGFSRAAAIANVTAGTLVNTGMFPKEDVYAYTFATPSAVENPPETGYENIFNIIDPMDLIPQVMPAEWGFGRYGRNLYLSVQEFTSFMGLYWTMLRAQTGRTLYRAESNYSPALNLRTRLLFGLLIDALSSRERFNEQFQPALVGIMQNKTASNVLGTLRNLMRNLSDATVGEQARLDALMDYSIRVFDAVLSRRGLRGTDSNAGSAAFRLFTEHTENAYLSDMSEIRSGEFGDNDRFSYVMVQGPVSLSIGDEEYSAVETLAPDGSRTHDAILDKLAEYYDDPNAVFYMERIGDTSVVAVPMDAPYTVTWRAEADGSVQSVYVRVKTEAGSRFEGMMSPVLTVKAGETGVAFRGEGGEALPLEGFEARQFDGRDLAEFLGIASLGVNWRPALTIVVGLPSLLACMLLCLVLSRSKRWRGRHPLWVWALLCVYGVAAVESETAYWFFADMDYQRMIWKSVGAICLVALFFATQKRNEFGRRRGLLLVALAQGLVGDVVITLSFATGATLFLMGHIVLICFFQSHRPMPLKRWVVWALLSALMVAAIVLRFEPQFGVYTWAIATYAPTLLLMMMSAFALPGRLRTCATVFLVSDVLMGLYLAFIQDPALHALYMLLFRHAMLLLATACSWPYSSEPIPDMKKSNGNQTK